MSISLILSEENKKILAGYIWVSFSLILVLILHLLYTKEADLTEIYEFLTVTLFISSILSLFFISISPERGLDYFFKRKKKIFHLYETIEDLPLEEIIFSPFLSKERGQFYGKLLVIIGFFFNLFLPLNRFIDTDSQALVFMWRINIFYTFEIIKIVIIALAIGILGLNLWRTEKKEYNRKIEIVWLYYSIMSQPGWKDYCKEELLSLERSLTLDLWKNAEYYIQELWALLNNAIKDLKKNLSKIKVSLRFLGGKEKYFQYFMKKKEEITRIEENFLRAKILGLKFVNSEVFGNIDMIIKDFIILYGNYTAGFENLIERRLAIRRQINQTELDSPVKDSINSFLNDLVLDKYHITANKQPELRYKEKNYQKVRKIIQGSKFDGNLITQWFESRTIENFYDNFCEDQFKILKDLLDQKLVKMRDLITNSNKELEKIMKKLEL